MKREFRVFKASQLRASEDGKGITGYAAVFNVLSEDLGWFREMVMPGAFSRCLGTNPDVRCLFNHDPGKVLGRTKSGTLRLKEDNTGLQFDCDLPETIAAKDVSQLISRGDIDQCSFGFMVNTQNWREEKDASGIMQLTRELVDVNLFDVSPVTYAAYPQTSVSARSLWPDGEPEDVLAHRKGREALPADDEETVRHKREMFRVILRRGCTGVEEIWLPGKTVPIYQASQ
jgi:uncharacterized protein